MILHRIVLSISLFGVCGWVYILTVYNYNTAADEAEPGQALSIKLSSGQMVEGNIVVPHFYDPDNLRQEM